MDSAILGYRAVLTAAPIAFGSVVIHRLEDGNGRIHRFLLHHVPAKRGFMPEETVFPISSVILDDIAGHRNALEIVSRPLLQRVKWQSTEKGNVAVLNDTVDHDRDFDATAHAEFLLKCIERAVERCCVRKSPSSTTGMPSTAGPPRSSTWENGPWT